jgi:hypothetical protein
MRMPLRHRPPTTVDDVGVRLLLAEAAARKFAQRLPAEEFEVYPRVRFRPGCCTRFCPECARLKRRL